MKKMYLAIFLIILVVFVFAGCLSFSGSISTSTTAAEELSSDEYLTNTPDDIYENESTDVNITDDESTTAAPVIEEPVTEEVTQAVIENNAPANSEYSILKTGTFYMTGSMIDKTATKTPMEIAITPNSLYMLADFNGVPMGMLINGKKLYMIYPAKKSYLELSESIMSMAGLDVGELMDSDTINFDSYGDLSEAKKVAEVTLNGRVCQVYYFDVNGGESRVYMDGTKLVRLASYDANGKLVTATDITSISATVPSDKSAPPSNYKAYKGITGMVSFMTLLEGVV